MRPVHAEKALEKLLPGQLIIWAPIRSGGNHRRSRLIEVGRVWTISGSMMLTKASIAPAVWRMIAARPREMKPEYGDVHAVADYRGTAPGLESVACGAGSLNSAWPMKSARNETTSATTSATRPKTTTFATSTRGAAGRPDPSDMRFAGRRCLTTGEVLVPYCV
jgi:hypothetical protein